MASDTDDTIRAMHDAQAAVINWVDAGKPRNPLTQFDLRRLAQAAWGWAPVGGLAWVFLHGDGYDTYGWYLIDSIGENYQLPTRVTDDEAQNHAGNLDQGRVVLTETDAYSAWAYAIGRSPTT